MDRGAWWATVQKVVKSWTQLTTHRQVKLTANITASDETENFSFEIRKHIRMLDFATSMQHSTESLSHNSQERYTYRQTDKLVTFQSEKRKNYLCPRMT